MNTTPCTVAALVGAALLAAGCASAPPAGDMSPKGATPTTASANQAVRQAVGDKQGITRYGHSYVPLDEALSRVVIDFSGRPGLVLDAQFTSGMIGGFDTQLTHEFFQGFVNHAGATLHIDNLRGVNAHHQCETVFKAFARALRAAVERDPRSAGTIPSTKGSL